MFLFKLCRLYFVQTFLDVFLTPTDLNGYLINIYLIKNIDYPSIIIYLSVIHPPIRPSSICLSVHPSIHPPIYHLCPFTLSIHHLSVHLSIHHLSSFLPSFHQSIHPTIIYMSICPSIFHLSVCLSVHPYFHLCNQNIHTPTHPSIHLYVHTSIINPSFHLFVHPPINQNDAQPW